jgi:hypothetical protein
MSCGFIASARTIAARCCWPPDRRSGYSPFLSRSPKRRRRSTASVGLENDPDAAPHLVCVHLRPRDLLAEKLDAASVDRLEQVHAAQERRFARARRADQAHDFVGSQLDVDALQDLSPAERLVQALDLENGHGAHRAAPSASCRRRSRMTSQSVRRASAIVSRTKRIAVTR